MFKDVGEEIKLLAKLAVILLTIPNAILGIVIWIIFAQDEQGMLGFSICIISVFIGYLLARMSAILLYAYSEIVDCVTTMKEILLGKLQGTVTSNSPAPDVPKKPSVSDAVAGKAGHDTDTLSPQNITVSPVVEKVPFDTRWTCRACKTINAYWTSSCKNCGRPKSSL